MPEQNVRRTELIDRPRNAPEKDPPTAPIPNPGAVTPLSQRITVPPTPSRTNLKVTSHAPSTWDATRWTHFLHHRVALDILMQGMLTGQLLTTGVGSGARELSTEQHLSSEEAREFCETIQKFVGDLTDEQWKYFEKLLKEVREQEWGYAVFVLAEEARRQLAGSLEKDEVKEEDTESPERPDVKEETSSQGSSVSNASARDSDDSGLVMARKGTGVRRRQKGPKKLIPPFNFCHVEDGLYRSAEPAPMNFPFIDQLQLKSLIWLDHSTVSDSLRDFLSHRKIALHHISLPRRPDPWHESTLTAIVSALEVIISKANLPALICCEGGCHFTGIVLGCLRRLQGWNLSSVLEEYRRFNTEKADVADEVCIEFFEVDGVKARRDMVPHWLWLE